MASVLVIGGGPSGASFATRMAQLGVEVTLVERAIFPRLCLGESLSPGVKPLLAATGAWPSVLAARFPAARDVRVIWEADEIVHVKSGSEGLLVDRGHFDQLLIAHATLQGVRVLQPAHVVAKRRSDSGWVVDISHSAGREAIHVDLIADARGRPGQAGQRRCVSGQRTLAVFAYWRGGCLPQAIVAAGEAAWYWGVPLPDGHVNAQVFLDVPRLRKVPGATLEQRYRLLLASSPLSGALSQAEIVGSVCAIDCTASCTVDPISDGLIRLGDAALTLDPISSSGVQKALQTALSGAIVANTLLRRPFAESHARSFYRNTIAAAGARHATWAAGHYEVAARSRPNLFWSSRSKPLAQDAEVEGQLDVHEVVTLSPQARFENVPCLGAEFVELQRALVHPSLEEPVAYLSKQPLGALLTLDGPASCLSLVNAWSHRMPARTAVAICHWLRRRKILVPVAELESAA